mgnify:CR=1 FL=1
MRALQLIEDRKLELTDVPPPPPPGPGEVTVRIKVVALNHIDVWGWRGMAFAKRKLPIVVGRESRGGTVPAAVPNPLQDPAKASGPSLPRARMIMVKCEFVWTTKRHPAEI